MCRYEVCRLLFLRLRGGLRVTRDFAFFFTFFFGSGVPSGGKSSAI